MFRVSIIRSALPAARSFSTSFRIMAAGDASKNPSIGKHEKAQEDMTVRAREHEKLLEMKKKLADHHKQLETLETSINDIIKKSDDANKK